MSNTNTGAAQLLAEIQSRITAAVNTILNALVLENQNLKLQLDELSIKVDSLSASVTSVNKKPIGNNGNKATATSVVKVESGPAVIAAPTSFPVNKNIFFRAQFKLSEDFRKEYITPEMQQLLDNDPVVQGKKDETQKLTEMSKKCYDFIKNNKDTTAMKKLEQEYVTSKGLYMDSIKQPQQNADVRTPPQTPKNEPL